MFSSKALIKVGPFYVEFFSNIKSVFSHIELLYDNYPELELSDFHDIHVSVNRADGIRRWYKCQAIFSYDGYRPFLPLPLNQAAAFFEWGLNWAISSSAHQYLIFHAAILERDGQCLIMPGSPGSGKSTLCAALSCSGWRLFSDEMALLSLANGLMYPLPRPISLKNDSIQIIKKFAPEAIFGDVITNTSKGAISHMKSSDNAVAMQDIPGLPAILLFPHFKADVKPQLNNISKGVAFMNLAENAFNFNILGSEGFNAMADLIDKVKCYDFSYPDLDSALDGINSLL